MFVETQVWMHAGSNVALHMLKIFCRHREMKLNHQFNIMPGNSHIPMISIIINITDPTTKPAVKLPMAMFCRPEKIVKQI